MQDFDSCGALDCSKIVIKGGRLRDGQHARRLSWDGGYIYISIYIYRRFRGASPVYPTPRNREIGFVSSSFSFRACRACGRGKAVRAHVERYPYRWASRMLGSTCLSGAFGVNYLRTGAWVLLDFGCFCGS